MNNSILFLLISFFLVCKQKNLYDPCMLPVAPSDIGL